MNEIISRWAYGTIILESKDDLEARREASPDDGNNLAMSFAVKVAAKQKLNTESMYRPWGVPASDL
jgi:hypothetical protein